MRFYWLICWCTFILLVLRRTKDRVTFISNNAFGVGSFSCSFRPSWFGSDPTRSHFMFIRFGETIHWLRGTWKSHSHLAANQTQGRTPPAIYLFLRKHYGSVVCPLSHQLWPTSSEFCINAHYKMLSEKISLVHAQIRQIKRWHLLCHYLDRLFTVVVDELLEVSMNSHLNYWVGTISKCSCFYSKFSLIP